MLQTCDHEETQKLLRGNATVMFHGGGNWYARYLEMSVPLKTIAAILPFIVVDVCSLDVHRR